MLYLVLFLSMAGVSAFSFLPEESKTKVLGGVLFSFVFFYLVFFAGLRAPEIAPDYLNYVDWLHRVGGSLDSIFAEFKDPGFLLTFSLVNWLGFPDYVFFSLIAFISLFAKLVFSRNVFFGYFTYLVFFLIFSRFYIVHDMVQVRVGAAIALASCGMIFLFRGQLSKGLIFYLLGLSFHLSVIMFFPVIVLLVFGFKRLSRFHIAVLLLGSLALSSLISGFSGQLSQIGRLAPYLNGEYQTGALSLLSFYVLIRIALVLSVVTFFYNQLSETDHFVLGMTVVGLSLQILLSWNDSFSLRTAELFGMFDMACFVMLMRFLDYRSKISYGLLLLAIAVIFYMATLKVVDAYASVLS
ncbi:EpsG family protein [Pseudomonas gregormendelii]